MNISSLSNTLLSGASSVRNLKLQLALSGKPDVASYSPASATSTATKNISSGAMTFLTDYHKNLEELKTAANEVSNPKSANKLAAGAEDTGVVLATGNLQKISDNYKVEVEQLASGQINRSEGISASETMPTIGGSLSIKTDKGSFNLSLNAGGYSTNADMLKGYAEKINALDAGVTARVVTGEGGTASLEVEGNDGGEFTLSGSFAERTGLNNVAEEPKEAQFTITKNGTDTQSHTSKTNNFEVDGLSVQLKGLGETTISSGQNETQAVSDSLGKMVESYNKTMSFLKQNEDWGVGGLRQQKRMLTLPTSAKTMEQIGITMGSDGLLTFDSETFAKAMQNDKTSTMSTVDKVAQGIAKDATSGLNESSYSLVGNSLSATGSGSSSLYSTDSGYDMDAINFLSTYDKNGVYNSVNMMAVSILMNLSV